MILIFNNFSFLIHLLTYYFVHRILKLNAFEIYLLYSNLNVSHNEHFNVIRVV